MNARTTDGATIRPIATGVDFAVAGARLVALPSGAAWWPDEATLIVADLHLETGSAFARRGALVPPFDTRATLARLAADVAAHRPARVISLGDAFHDGGGPTRMEPETAAVLADLRAGRDWIWVAGNHDAEVEGEIGGIVVEEIAIGPLGFRHHPAPKARALGEIAGHLHPAARVRVRSGTVRRHCLACDGRRAILPAYGAYTGGLDVASRAFAGLFETADLVVHLIGEAAVHRFPATSIAGLDLSRDGTEARRANR